MSAIPDFPPKDHSTLQTLNIMRNSLIGELNTYCIKDWVCYDMPRAKDFMRTATCRICDVLKKEYSSHCWDREDEVADEAAHIAIACWNIFETQEGEGFWLGTLRSTVVQHVGRPLRKRGVPDNLMPPGAYVASPLLAMIAERETRTQEQIISATLSEDALGTSARPISDLSAADRRAHLLGEYKKATGNPSNKKIYESQNSGIHKPEFYQWKNGILSAESRTTKQFEQFLKARKKPIPRRPTSGA